MVLAALLLVHPGLARAGNPSANIDQCRNGSFSSPTACTDGAWVNGNLGPENAHFREGDSVPFRITFINLVPGTSYSVTIGYDTIVGGKNAYDYLTTYNRTESSADPCTGVSGCSGSPTFFGIPTDSSISFTNPAAAQVGGSFAMWNGTITGAVYDSTYSGGHQQITVTFTAGNDTVVLAWGGHVATQSDWGAGNSAGSISGSPYHMSLDSCSGPSFSCGSQDRSMKASVIAQVPANFDTTASPDHVFLGGTVTDTATLSGSNGAVTGTVAFFVCGPDLAGNPDCSSGGVQVGSAKTLDVSGSATSDAFTAPGIGHYCFRAEYTPDQFAAYAAGSHTNTTTECFNVLNPATTTVTTPSNGGVITLGGSITDSAVVTGNDSGGSPTGTVSFFVCAKGVSPCASDGTALPGNPVSLTPGAGNTSSATSGSFTPTAAGTYCFRGVYTPANGSPYLGSSDASTDECFTVNKAPAPTVTTPSNGKSIILGGSITDSAVVTGNAAGGSPTGSVSFFVCAQGVSPCASGGTALTGNPVNLTPGAGNTSSATSGAFTPTNIGTYCFRGDYSGDDNYNPSSDATSGECFTVGLAPTTTVTTPQHSSITLGASITDTASVSGNLVAGNPTGTVDFFVCGPIATGTCSSGGTALPGNPVPLGANGMATSGSFTPSVAGRYCFRGVFNSSTLNYSGSSDSRASECFTVGKAPSTTVTTPQHGSITLGDSITDSATVTGNTAGGTPTGSVSFFVCGPMATGTCSSGGTALSGNPVTLSGGSATSSAFTPTAAGRYCFRGDYSGDDNYNASSDSSSGECFTVGKAPSTTVTTPQHASITLGDSITDSATVSGSGDGTPSGTVSFFVCGPIATGTCSSGGTALAGNPVTLVSGSATSGAFTPTAAGRYCFRGDYSGDNNYSGSSDSSESECFTVGKAPTTTVTTPQHASITLGDSITDSATVSGSGAGTPTGSVSFFVCGPIATGTCSSGGTALSGNPVTLVAGSATSGAFTPTAAGRYCFRGDYSGDNNYNASSDSRDSECFTVNKAPSTTVTSPSNNGVITLGDSITDSASVSGIGDGTPTGSVSFFVCGPIAVGTCSSGGTALSGNPVTLVGGSATSGAFTPTAPGRYCFRGDYSGDGNYNASSDSTSGECFLVLKAPSTTTTTPSGASIGLGGSVTDSASVSGTGDGTPTGTVSFFVCGPIATGTCSSGGSAVGSAVALSGGHATSAAFTPGAPGRYCFRGEYSGDDNYNPSSDSGLNECFSVAVPPATLQVVKHVNPSNDPGRFNLVIDNSTRVANVGDGGSTDAIQVDAGQHNVAEEAGISTSLSDYNSSISCKNGSTEIASGNGISLNVNVPTSANVVCTITNTRKPGTLTVIKSLAPANDPGKFNLQIDGATLAANVGNGGTTGAQSVVTGSHTVGETPGTATSLSDYNSSISCVNGATNVASGSGSGPLAVNVPSGAAIVCTISNTRKSIDLAVTKVASPTSTTVGSRVTYTMVVTNNGPGTATGVVATDTMPAELAFVSVSTTKGTCSGTSVITCQLGTLASGESVTITVVATATTAGTFTNTVIVVGNEPESNTANNTATATVTVAGPFVPPNPCYSLTVSPHALSVGHRTVLIVHVTQAGKPVKGAHVQIKGAGILKLSGPTNAKGIVKIAVKPAKPGIVLITSATHKGCGKQRVGAIGAFTPPVTG